MWGISSVMPDKAEALKIYKQAAKAAETAMNAVLNAQRRTIKEKTPAAISAVVSAVEKAKKLTLNASSASEAYRKALGRHRGGSRKMKRRGRHTRRQ